MNSYMIYLSDCKHVIITADKWEKTEDSLIFKKTKDNAEIFVTAVFNFHNIVGMSEVR